MLTTSHQKIHLEKKLLMDSQEKIKEIGKANKQRGGSQHLASSICFLSEALFATSYE